MRQTVLVTGASGFIGSNLLPRLLASGNRVICLVRRDQRLEGVGRGEDDLESLPFDSFSKECLHEALKARSFDRVYHLAAYGVRPTDRDWQQMVSVNVEASAALVGIAAAAGCRQFVFAGSSAEYAAQTSPVPFDEISPLETRKLYGSSKAAASILISALCEAHGISYAGLRFFNVYGPGEAPHRLLPSLVRGIASGEIVPLSEGSQVRDFVHIDDAVSALLCAADMLSSRANLSGLYNCASGIGHTVRTFAELVGDVCGAKEGQLAFGRLPLREGEQAYVVGNATKFHLASGWTCRSDLREGIAKSILSPRP